MQILDNISDDARQKHTILLDADNSPIVLELTYRYTQLGWFLDVTYDKLNFKVCGLRVTTNTNLLNQWRNLLPFGIICQCKEAQDSLLIEDFLVRRATLGILSKEEVESIVNIQSKLRSEDYNV